MLKRSSRPPSRILGEGKGKEEKGEGWKRKEGVGRGGKGRGRKSGEREEWGRKGKRERRTEREGRRKGVGEGREGRREGEGILPTMNFWIRHCLIALWPQPNFWPILPTLQHPHDSNVIYLIVE